MIEATYYTKKEDSDRRVQCTLCPKGCIIARGEYGFCMARINREGILYSENYGQVSSLALDPIEKKPLYRFMPGGTILSLGLYGCNMNCPFCQNHTIAKLKPAVEAVSVEQIVKMAQDMKKYRNIGVAYTYNEPLIGYEFVFDCCKAVRRAGMKNVLVSNGLISLKPLEELIPYIDAANIDLKCYNKKRYKEVFEGNLDVVKNTIATMRQAGVHVEITMLIVPGLSDDTEEFKEAVRFISDLSCDIPVHLTRYFPARHYDKPPTDLNILQRFKDLAEKELNHVYLGNV